MLGVLADLESIYFYKLIIQDNKPNFSKINFKINSFETLTQTFKEFNLQSKLNEGCGNQNLQKNYIENLYKY